MQSRSCSSIRLKMVKQNRHKGQYMHVQKDKQKRAEFPNAILIPCLCGIAEVKRLNRFYIALWRWIPFFKHFNLP